MRKSTAVTLLIGLGAIFLGSTMLEKVQWVDENGKVQSAHVKKIGTGSFSTVFLDPMFQEVYTVTNKRDMSKVILADIYQQSPNKNLPAVTYLGETIDGSALVTKMPFYHEIKTTDPLFETTQFLRDISQDWRLNHFAGICFEAERSIPGDNTNLKASIFRKELLKYIKSNAGNQPQIENVIQALELVDRYISQSDNEQSLDFDTILNGFQHANFMKDSQGNIVVVDPVFPNAIRKCRTFITDYISSSIVSPPITENLDQFLREIEP